MRNLFATILIVLGLAPLAFAERGNLSAKITRDASLKVDLAVGVFDVNATVKPGSIAEKARTVLFSDLEFSDFFNLIDVSRNAEELIPGFEDRAPIDFDRYYLIGTKGLALAQISETDDEVLLVGRLYDSNQGEMVLGKRYQGPKDKWRQIVHRFADEIVERFTGTRGIASTEILYVSDLPGNKEVYRMDYDGANQRRVTSNGEINISPAWHHQREGFAFTSYMDGRPEIFFHNFSLSGENKMIAYPGINSAPAYSPDGKRIAVTLSKDGNSEIYVGNADGTDLVRVTYNKAIDTSPAWSPNGRQLVFVSDRTGKPQIFITDVEGMNQRRVTFDGHSNDEPAWSPNGDLIAFSSRRWGATDICIMDVMGQSIRILTGSRGLNEAPSFSPNGLHLVYSSNLRDNYHIYTMDLDGSDKRRLTFGPGSFSQPRWSPY